MTKKGSRKDLHLTKIPEKTAEEVLGSINPSTSNLNYANSIIDELAFDGYEKINYKDDGNLIKDGLKPSGWAAL